MASPHSEEPLGRGAQGRIGIDIGGTKTEAVALDAEGRIESSFTVPTVRGADTVVATAGFVISTLAERTGRRVDDFASIGVGIPGQVDRESGLVSHAVNLGVTSLALGPALHERTGLPVEVDNDVTAAALGATHLMGLTDTVAYLNLGTGLAAGIVVDGRPWRGARGVAGEIGHLPADPLGRRCPCGQRGCLETVASGSALRSSWPAGGDHPGRRLLAAIAEGDEGARAAFDRLVEGAAACVRILALSVDPGTVVVGGGLRLLGAPLADGLRAVLDGWAAESPFIAALGLSDRVRMLAADAPAGAVGAALICKR